MRSCEPRSCSAASWGSVEPATSPARTPRRPRRVTDQGIARRTADPSAKVQRARIRRGESRTDRAGRGTENRRRASGEHRCPPIPPSGCRRRALDRLPLPRGCAAHPRWWRGRVLVTGTADGRRGGPAGGWCAAAAGSGLRGDLPGRARPCARSGVAAGNLGTWLPTAAGGIDSVRMRRGVRVVVLGVVILEVFDHLLG